MTGNRIIGKITDLGHELSGIRTRSVSSGQAAKLVEYGVRIVLAAVLTRAELFGSISPFAVGFVAASGAGIPGLLALCASAAGFLMHGDFMFSLKYIAMSLLVFSASSVFRDTKLYTTNLFAPLNAAVMSFCTGFVYVSDAGWTTQACLLFGAEILLTGGMAMFYKTALSPWAPGDESGSETRHNVGVMVTIVTVFIAITGITIFGTISIGRAAAVLLILAAAFKGGATAGCACGVVVGAAMDAASGGAPVYTMAFSLSALVAGIFSRRGRVALLISYTVTNAMVLLWTWNNFMGYSILYEVFIASVIFLLLPSSALAFATAIFPVRMTGYGAAKAREYTRGRVALTAGAFRDLYETVRDASGGNTNDNEIATVFDRASEKSCRKCAASSRCWQKEYQTTVDVLNGLSEKMTEHGSVAAEDFPNFFADKCENLASFTKSINDELHARTRRRQFRSRLREKQDTAYTQYAEVADILDKMADELGDGITFDPVMERKFQKYLRSLDIEASVAVFRDTSGRLHAELSGTRLTSLKHEENYLDKLSAVAGTRLCTPVEKNFSTRLVLLEAEPLAVSVGIAAMKKNGQNVSGDSGTYFKTDDGILYILLSDGMGSGVQAAECSASAIRVLERFLRAGVAPESALRILNDLMLLRNETDTSYATVDLMCFNLFTGDVKMFKYGAAPSYIIRNGSVSRIKSKNLAAGLSVSSSELPEYTKVKLDPSVFAVIVSDGVLGGSDDAWLKRLAAKYSGTDAKELARLILEAATEKFSCEDDMTVLTVYTQDRE